MGIEIAEIKTFLFHAKGERKLFLKITQETETLYLCMTVLNSLWVGQIQLYHYSGIHDIVTVHGHIKCV